MSRRSIIVWVLLLVMLTAPHTSAQSYTLPSEQVKFTRKLCSEMGFPFHIAMAVMEKESDFNPNCEYKGSHGLFQIWGGNIEGLGITNVYDPYQNIRGGISTLTNYLIRYDGDMYDALNAYNLGPSKWDKYKKKGWKWSYADDVIDRSSKYK